MNQKRYLIFLGILGALAFFPLAMPFSYSIDTSRAAIFNQVPMEMGKWKGKDVSVDEQTYQILETRNVLSRFYESKGERIHLLIVASEKDRRVAHPPEVCYTSSNYIILNERIDSLNWGRQDIPLKQFLAQYEKDPAQKQEVMYVYKVGKRFTTNYFSQQLQFAWDRLTRQESQVLLIRVAGREDKTLKEFLSEVIPHVS